MNSQNQVEVIKSWLGSGSINIFGLPYSGKDTIGSALANLLGAEFLSSGHLLRRAGEKVQEAGNLSPTNVFYDVVLPAFYSPDFAENPLILSSVGRWSGEEQRVIETAADSGHPIKVVLFVNIPESEMISRLEAAYEIGDRSGRKDDSMEILKTRLSEFNEKTLPVIEAYRKMGLLIEINGIGQRGEVLNQVIEKLANLASTSQ